LAKQKQMHTMEKSKLPSLRKRNGLSQPELAKYPKSFWDGFMQQQQALIGILQGLVEKMK
jgi:uncharacterized protein HemY